MKYLGLLGIILMVGCSINVSIIDMQPGQEVEIIEYE